MRFGDENGTNLRRSPFSLILVPLDLEDEVIYAACIEKGGRSGRVQELTLKDSEEPPSHGPKREPPQCPRGGAWVRAGRLGTLGQADLLPIPPSALAGEI